MEVKEREGQFSQGSWYLVAGQAALATADGLTPMHIQATLYYQSWNKLCVDNTILLIKSQDSPHVTHLIACPSYSIESLRHNRYLL